MARQISIIAILLLIGANALPADVSATRVGEKPLSFGLTPVMVDTDYGLIEKWLNYLSRKLGEKVTVTQRRSYQEILTMVKYGEVDFAWICGFPYVNNRDILQLIAVPLYRGKPLYQSYLIVSKESRYKSLQDLEGKIHAFSDVDSNSGHLVTRFQLSQLKRIPEDFFSTYIFTYAHENVIRSVASGLTDSGSVDGYIWEVIERSHSELAGQTKVIQRSDYYGFPPIVAPKSFSAEKLLKIRAVLVGMNRDPMGRFRFCGHREKFPVNSGYRDLCMLKATLESYTNYY